MKTTICVFLNLLLFCGGAMAAKPNQPPVVSAGPDQTITLPAAASLSGTASDDGLPSARRKLSTTWARVSGPGTVIFGNASSLTTTASFSLAGSYVLRLTGSDGPLATSDYLTITVNPSGVTRVKIMPLGDSITQGNTLTNSYRRPLWHILQSAGYRVDFVGTSAANYLGLPPNPDFDMDNEGHWGWTAAAIRDDMALFLQTNVPDVVLMHLGTNDVWGGRSADVTVRELEGIIDEIRAVNPSVKILVALLIGSADTALNSALNSLNALIPTMVSTKNTQQSPVILVDQNTGFYPLTDTYDYYHPNSSGEQKMSDKWFAVLAPLLNSMP